jgi:hypothetical protein
MPRYQATQLLRAYCKKMKRCKTSYSKLIPNSEATIAFHIMGEWGRRHETSAPRAPRALCPTQITRRTHPLQLEHRGAACSEVFSGPRLAKVLRPALEHQRSSVHSDVSATLKPFSIL